MLSSNSPHFPVRGKACHFAVLKKTQPLAIHISLNMHRSRRQLPNLFALLSLEGHLKGDVKRYVINIKTRFKAIMINIIMLVTSSAIHVL